MALFISIIMLSTRLAQVTSNTARRAEDGLMHVTTCNFEVLAVG